MGDIQNVRPDPATWQYWFDFVANRLTPDEWFVIALSLLMGWVVTEILKRNLVWKKQKNKPLVTFVTIGPMELKLKIPYIISFFITAVLCVIFWPDKGAVDGWLRIVTASSVAGVLSSPIYSFVIFLLSSELMAKLFDKIGLNHGRFIAFICGNKRKEDIGGPDGIERRGP